MLQFFVSKWSVFSWISNTDIVLSFKENKTFFNKKSQRCFCSHECAGLSQPIGVLCSNAILPMCSLFAAQTFLVSLRGSIWCSYEHLNGMTTPSMWYSVSHSQQVQVVLEEKIFIFLWKSYNVRQWKLKPGVLVLYFQSLGQSVNEWMLYVSQRRLEGWPPLTKEAFQLI